METISRCSDLICFILNDDKNKMKNYEIKSIITELFVFVIIEVRVLVNEDNGLRRKVKNKKNT